MLPPMDGARWAFFGRPEKVTAAHTVSPRTPACPTGGDQPRSHPRAGARLRPLPGQEPGLDQLPAPCVQRDPCGGAVGWGRGSPLGRTPRRLFPPARRCGAHAAAHGCAAPPLRLAARRGLQLQDGAAAGQRGAAGAVPKVRATAGGALRWARRRLRCSSEGPLCSAVQPCRGGLRCRGVCREAEQAAPPAPMPRAQRA